MYKKLLKRSSTEESQAGSKKLGDLSYTANMSKFEEFIY